MKHSLEHDLSLLRESRQKHLDEIKATQLAQEKAHAAYIREEFFYGIANQFSRLRDRTKLSINVVFPIAEFEYNKTKFFLCFEEYNAPCPMDDDHGTYLATKWVLKRDSIVGQEAYIAGGYEWKNAKDLYKNVLEAIDELMRR